MGALGAEYSQEDAVEESDGELWMPRTRGVLWAPNDGEDAAVDGDAQGALRAECAREDAAVDGDGWGVPGV